MSPTAAQTKNVGQTFTITPTISPSNANNKNVNWTSSNTNVATVSKASTASGTAVTVTCKAAGTTTITATAADGRGRSASVSLTVYDKVTVTAFSYSSTSINVGQVTAAPTKTTTGTAKSGPTYSSSNTSIATVNSSTGVVTGKAVGTATITISYTNYDGTTATKTCSVTIKQAGPSIATNPNNTTVSCSSSYVKNIALPNQTSSTYYGMTSAGNRYYYVFIQFTEEVISGTYSYNASSMPTNTNIKLEHNNTSCWEAYYGDAVCLGMDNRYRKNVIELKSGATVTIELTGSKSSGTGNIISNLKIY